MIWNIWWKNSCEEHNWQRRRSMFCREKILFHKQGEEKKTREWGMTHYCSLTHHLYVVFKEPWDLDWPRKSQDFSHRIGVKGWLFWQELCGEYVQNKRFQASRRISQIPLPRPVLHKPSCHLVIKYLTLHAVHSGTPHFCWPYRLLAVELRQQ